jgi:hypothetical protein
MEECAPKKMKKTQPAILDLNITLQAEKQAKQVLELPITVGVLTGMAIFLTSVIADKPFIGLGTATTVIAIGIAVGYYNSQQAYDEEYNKLYQQYFGENNLVLAGDNGLVADLA